MDEIRPNEVSNEIKTPQDIERLLEAEFTKKPELLAINYLLLMGVAARNGILYDRIRIDNQNIYGQPTQQVFIHFLDRVTDAGLDEVNASGSNGAFHLIYDYLFTKSNQYIEEAVKHGDKRFPDRLHGPRESKEFLGQLELFTHYKRLMYDTGPSPTNTDDRENYMHAETVTLLRTMNDDISKATQDMFVEVIQPYFKSGKRPPDGLFNQEILRAYCDSSDWEHKLDQLLEDEPTNNITPLNELIRNRRVGKALFEYIRAQAPDRR